MTEIVRESKKSSNIIEVIDVDRLSEGYFKNNISFLALPSEKSSENWKDEDWNAWVKENTKRILKSKIYFKNKINFIARGAFEDWQADSMVFEEGIGKIEDEAIFAGEAKSITIEKGIETIGDGNFSNVFRLGFGLRNNIEGVDFVVNGDIGNIGEGSFSDAIYNKIVFNGKIEKIENHTSYIIPSFSNLTVNYLCLPEGLESLGRGNFLYSHFGYLSLPSTLFELEENTFIDSLLDILVVHNMDLDFENREIKHSYKKLILDAGEGPIILGYPGSSIEKYANDHNYEFNSIINIEKAIENIDDNGYTYILKIFPNEYIRNKERFLSLNYRLLLNEVFDKGIEILDIKYNYKDNLDIKLDENLLHILFDENFRFGEEEIKIILKVKGHELNDKINSISSSEFKIG